MSNEQPLPKAPSMVSLEHAPCTPAFAVVVDADRGNVGKPVQQVDAAGFDGAVVPGGTSERRERAAGSDTER
jgi:hypothetical protein